MSHVTASERQNEESQMYEQKEQSAMAMRSVKKLLSPLLRPLMRLIQNTQLRKLTVADNLNSHQQNAYNTSLEDMRNDTVAQMACDDNAANEKLERQLLQELLCCPEGAAVIVRQGEKQCVVPVHRQLNFVPVHFVRTSSGTFFWTSMESVTRQQEQLMRTQYDRWGQA